MVNCVAYRQISTKMKSTSNNKQEPNDESEIAELVREFEKRSHQFESTANNLDVIMTNNNNVSMADAVTNSIPEGKFGWEEVKEFRISIPYILRGNCKYVPHRIVHQKIWSIFIPNFTTAVFDCMNLTLDVLRPWEVNLLDEINYAHCDSAFGKKKFTTSDTLMSLETFRDSFRFLITIFNILILEHDNDKCGFYKINNEHVPFIFRNNKKALPIFYFDCDNEYLHNKSFCLSPAEMMYLRFCCYVQGIGKRHYEVDTCRAVYLEDLVAIFPQTTQFEMKWPQKVNLNILKAFGKQRREEKIDVKTPKLKITFDMYNNVHCILPAMPSKNNSTASQEKHFLWPLPRGWKNPYRRLIKLEDADIPKDLSPPYKIYPVSLGKGITAPCVNMFPYVNSTLLISANFIYKSYYSHFDYQKFAYAIYLVGFSCFTLNRAQAAVYNITDPIENPNMFIRLDDLMEGMHSIHIIVNYT